MTLEEKIENQKFIIRTNITEFENLMNENSEFGYAKSLSEMNPILINSNCYRVTGLTVEPELLPESLYCFLAEDATFTIPLFYHNATTEQRQSFNNNMMIVDKILSYFEYEKCYEKTKTHKVDILNQDLEIQKIVNIPEFFYPSAKHSELYYAYNEAYSLINDFKTKFDLVSFNFLKEELDKIETRIKYSCMHYLGELNKTYLSLDDELEDFNLIDNIVQKIEDKLTEILNDEFETENTKIKLQEKLNITKENIEYNKKIFISLKNLFENNKDFIYATNRTTINIQLLNIIYQLYLGSNTEINCYKFLDSILFEKGFKFEYLNNNDIQKTRGFAKHLFLSDMSIIEKSILSLNHGNYEIIDKFIDNNESRYNYSIKNIFNSFKNKIEDKKKTLFFQMLRQSNFSIEEIYSRFEGNICLEWSNEISKELSFSINFLKDQISNRYYMAELRNYVKQRNLIIDSMLPSLIVSNNLNFENANYKFKSSNNIYTKTAYAISPFTAAITGCKKIPIEHLTRILGFDKKFLKDMMTKIQKKSLNMVFAGTGGTGINTITWLYEIMEMCNIPYLFEKVHCFEKEEAELHNMIRFPVDPYTVNYDHSIDSSKDYKMHIIANQVKALSKFQPSFNTFYICTKSPKDAESAGSLYINYPTNIFNVEYRTEPVKNEDGDVIDFKNTLCVETKNNTIIYGAPDISARVHMTNAGHFISATHASDSCNIFINPHQDTEIQVESYGMIQLTVFFMNQLRMAIRLLEILSQDNMHETLKAKDLHDFNYSFDGIPKLKNDRTYNFKIDKNISIMTDQELNNNNMN